MRIQRFLQMIKEGFSGRNPGVVGALIGFLLALSLVLFGFWRTLFIIILTVVGYLIGIRYFGSPEAFRELLDRLFPPGMFR